MGLSDLFINESVDMEFVYHPPNSKSKWFRMIVNLIIYVITQMSCIISWVMDKAINNGLACSVLCLSTTGLFPARRKISEHETQSSALMFF